MSPWMPLQLCQMSESSPALLISSLHSSPCICCSGAHRLWALPSLANFSPRICLLPSACGLGRNTKCLCRGSGSAVKLRVLVLGSVGWRLTEIPATPPPRPVPVHAGSPPEPGPPLLKLRPAPPVPPDPRAAPVPPPFPPGRGRSGGRCTFKCRRCRPRRGHAHAHLRT